MLKLNPDPFFHHEILRIMGAARYGAADVGELLKVAEEIEAGDFESWTAAFQRLAERVEREMDRGSATDATVRDAMFRAANYWRAADFFIHGDIHDSRIRPFWANQTRCFGEAIARLPIAGRRFEVRTDVCTIPATLYLAATDGKPRPTILMFNGYDGGQEDMAHINGFAALERGVNVVAFEGPGQPSVRREQGVGFILDWERVVTPLLDEVLTFAEVDGSKVGLLGNSFGGYLAPRAAAFEHRLAGVICIDGAIDPYRGFVGSLTPQLRDALERQDRDAFDMGFPDAARDNTNLRWMGDQGIWAFKVETAYDVFDTLRGKSIEGLIDRIDCPVFVGCGEDDKVFDGQPQELAKALGDRGTLHAFNDDQAAGEHCQAGAAVVLNEAALDWFVDTVGAPRCARAAD